ncbi:hypothetical protein ACFQLX_16050 [Streptomyces polyrhachis]|uniref:Uncharacterized protein n=1 Tax=Streptomyces polyrhachis TaxID=1282885 RepID=A0ABW2GHM2_9ACTN
MDDQLRRVRIVSGSVGGWVEVDGLDVSRQVSGYSLRQRAGQAVDLVLHLSPAGQGEFDGLVRVAIGVSHDPGPAAAAFLAAIDARELERHVLARHDLLDGGPYEMTRGMLGLLREWALGQGAPEVVA